MGIPRLRSYTGPAVLSYGFQAVLSARLCLRRTFDPVLASGLFRPGRDFQHICSRGLAHPRDAVRLSDRHRRRISPHGDSELDRPVARPGPAVAWPCRALGSRPFRSLFFCVDRMAGRGGHRRFVPRRCGGRRSTGDHRRAELAQPEGPGAAGHSACRQFLLPPRSPFEWNLGHKPTPGHVRRYPTHHDHRRTYYPELHPELASTRKSRAAPYSVRPLRCSGDRRFCCGAVGLVLLSGKRGDRHCPRIGCCPSGPAPRPLGRRPNAQGSARPDPPSCLRVHSHRLRLGFALDPSSRNRAAGGRIPCPWRRRHRRDDTFGNGKGDAWAYRAQAQGWLWRAVHLRRNPCSSGDPDCRRLRHECRSDRARRRRVGGRVPWLRSRVRSGAKPSEAGRQPILCQATTTRVPSAAGPNCRSFGNAKGSLRQRKERLVQRL